VNEQSLRNVNLIYFFNDEFTFTFPVSRRRFFLMTYKGFKDGAGESPSTGLLALSAAMQMCDQVTLYAFGLWGQHARYNSERQSMYHYFHSLYGTFTHPSPINKELN
jgi:hypothetical protein